MSNDKVVRTEATIQYLEPRGLSFLQNAIVGPKLFIASFLHQTFHGSYMVMELLNTGVFKRTVGKRTARVLIIIPCQMNSSPPLSRIGAVSGGDIALSTV